MGTRADFYIGKGKDATWVGSITLDGYPEGVIDVLTCDTKQRFLEEVKKLSNYIEPSRGWPWPWKTSKTTDYSYYWTEEGIIILPFYHGKDFSHDNDAAPDYYGAGGLHNPNNVTDAGFIVLVGSFEAMQRLKSNLEKLSEEEPETNECDKEWEVWMEGYTVSGAFEKARFYGKFKAPTFRDACLECFKNDPENYFNKKDLTYWGCKLHDNETDAKKNFG